jgi:superfamily I DNA and/or RNA helicase
MATAGPSDSVSLLDEFISAINEEKKAKEKRSKDTRLSLSGGGRIYSGKSQWVYRFFLEQEFFIEDDTPVDIYIDDHKIPGEVVSSDVESINLSFEQDLGEDIPLATLVKSDTKLLEKQIARLDAVKAMPTGFNHEGCRKLFGFVQPQKYSITSEPINCSRYSPLPNQEQIAAIKKVFSEEVTFIWGPPGTGKTKTLGIIINELLKQEKSVLLVSHTNVAVDEILVKFASIESAQPLIDAGRILRIGPPAKEDSVLDQMNEDIIIHKQETAIFNRIENIDLETRKLQQSFEKLKKSRVDGEIKEYEEIQRAIDQNTSLLSQNNEEIASAQRIDQVNTQKIITFSEEITRLENASFLQRLFSGISIKSLKEEISRLQQLKVVSKEHCDALLSRKQQLKHQQNDLRIALESKKNSLESEIKGCDIAVPSPFSLRSIKELPENLRVAINTLQNEREILNRKIEDSRVRLRSNALIIACTLTKACMAPQVYSRQYSTFILDEASMAPLPLVYLAAGLVSTDSNHYIVAGDFRQLPPIAQSEEKFAEKWLKRDIFTQSGIVQSVDSNREDARLVMLRIQHRMHPEIVQLINNSMYRGQLASAPEVLAEKMKITALRPFENHSLILIDTSKINPWANWTHNKSKVNLYTAMLAVRLTQMIREEESSVETIGIITPYGAQAKLITTLLEEARIQRKKAISATVHRFQGNEQDCIVLDLVDGPPYEKVGQIIKGNFVDSEAGKLINVAVSRAKGKLIVIAHVDYLLKFKWSHLIEDDAIIQVIRSIQKTGLVIDAGKILPSYIDAKDLQITRSGLTLPHDDELSIWNENNFYPRFLEDIRNAKHRVIIYSPFLGKARLASLMETFRSVMDRGVRFFIITKKPEFQSHNLEIAIELIENLKKIGFDIILAGNGTGVSENFHEKIAFVDDTAFYHGSLNILSQRESSESMMIYRSPVLIAQMMKNFNIERVIKTYEYSQNGERTMR